MYKYHTKTRKALTELLDQYFIFSTCTVIFFYREHFSKDHFLSVVQWEGSDRSVVHFWNYSLFSMWSCACFPTCAPLKKDVNTSYKIFGKIRQFNGGEPEVLHNRRPFSSPSPPSLPTTWQDRQFSLTKGRVLWLYLTILSR